MLDDLKPKFAFQGSKAPAMCAKVGLNREAPMAASSNVHLVGSIGLDTVDEVFHACGRDAKPGGRARIR